MFDRLVDFVIDIIELFYFTAVVDQYEEGVRLRFGKFQKVLKPGLCYKLPFGIDDIMVENVVFQTKELPAQAFTTKDGVSCVATAVVSMKVRDIKKLLLEVEDAESVLADASRGSIRHILCSKTWVELQEGGAELDEEITKAVRRPAFNWGIEVIKVSLSDLAKARTVRLIHDGSFSGNIAMGDGDE